MKGGRRRVRIDSYQTWLTVSPSEDGELECISRVCDERFEISLADATDWVDIG